MSPPLSTSGPLTPAPLGPERRVVFHGAATIGGAPVSSVVVLAAVIAVFSFVPFSVVFSSGSSFPMSQGLYPLTGWLLGPWGGAVASGVGAMVGIFLAPHTAGIPWLTVAGAASAALFAGVIVPRGRNGLWAALGAGVLLVVALYWHQAVNRNGVAPRTFVAAYLVHAGALLLYGTPLRRLMAHLIHSAGLRRVAVGLFLGTWCATSLMMLGESMVGYSLLNWPAELFVMFAVVVPVETAVRSGIGAVVGTGVIAGLRAMALIRAREASF